MAGGAYVFIALCFAIGGGLVGRSKGSSFVLWFLICGITLFIGLFAVLLYRRDDEEPRRLCPSCGKICMLHDAICTRCGCELDFPDQVLQPGAPAL